MIKVLVIDTGWSAVVIGNYIEKELPVNVKEIINNNCELEDTENTIRPYIGEVDIIVLSNPIISAKFGRYFESKYPGQKFISYGWDLSETIQRYKKVMIFTPKRLRTSECYQIEKAKCQEQEIVELDCEKWVSMITSGGITLTEEANKEMEAFKGETIIINSSELLGIEDKLKKVINWRGDLIDLREGIVTAIEDYLNMKKVPSRGRAR